MTSFSKMDQKKIRHQIRKWIVKIIISSIALAIVYPGLIAILYLALSASEFYHSLVSDMWNFKHFGNLIVQGALMGFLLGLIFGGFKIMFLIIHPKDKGRTGQPASWLSFDCTIYLPMAGERITETLNKNKCWQYSRFSVVG